MSAITTTPVHWQPEPLTARVDQTRRTVVSRLISLGITVVLMVVFWWWRREEFAAVGGAVWVLYGLSLAVSLSFVAWAVVRWRRAVGETALVGEGLALVLGHAGVELPDARIPWDDLQAVRTVRGRWLHGPVLLVEQGGRSWSFPVEALDILPGSLDAAVRVYSSGRHGVDLTAIDD